MTHATKTTVLIITRDGEATIRECVKSVLALKLPGKEVIVVDDCSTDRTGEILATFGNEIHYIRNTKRMGIGQSRNIGLGKAHPDSVVFIIDGDLICTSVSADVDRVMKMLRDDPILVGASGLYKSERHCGDYNYITDMRRELLYQKQDRLYLYGISGFTTLSGGFCVLDLKKVADQRFPLGIDERSSEDLILQISLLNSGFRFAYTPYLTALHKHTRTLVGILSKTLQDAKGSVWAELETLGHGWQLPELEQVFSYPFPHLLCGFFIDSRLAFAIFLFACIPHLLGGGSSSKYHLGNRVALIAHSSIFHTAKMIYAFRELLSTNYKLKTKLKFVLHCVFSFPAARCGWLRRELWLRGGRF